MQYDIHRGYNSYVISRNNRRMIYGSDTAMTDAFAKLNDGAPYDLAIMGIGAYDPWIWAHSTPEQAVAMADAAGAAFHHAGASPDISFKHRTFSRTDRTLHPRAGQNAGKNRAA